MFWDGGWEQGLFHKHFLFYFVCVKYKDYNLIVKNNKMKITTTIKKKKNMGDFPGGTVVKNPPANAGHTGSSPGPGRSHMPRSN